MRENLVAPTKDQLFKEHPGYEMAACYETIGHANDHLVFTVFSKEDGIPVDCLKIPCRGNSFKIRGYWGKTFDEAKEHATQVMDRWFK